MDTTGTAPQDAAGALHEQGGDIAAGAADQARQVAGTAADEARAVVSTAKDQMGEVAGEVTAQARNLVEESKVQLRSQADQQAERIASSLRRLGDELRALTEGRVDEAGAVGDYVRQAASGVGRYAERIEQQGLDGVMDDVQRFARRRPGTFLLGALAAGFGVGRLLRANGSAAGSDGGGGASAGTSVVPASAPEAGLPWPSELPRVEADNATVVGMHEGPDATVVPVGASGVDAPDEYPPAGATS